MALVVLSPDHQYKRKQEERKFTEKGLWAGGCSHRRINTCGDTTVIQSWVRTVLLESGKITVVWNFYISASFHEGADTLLSLCNLHQQGMESSYWEEFSSASSPSVETSSQNEHRYFLHQKTPHLCTKQIVSVQDAGQDIKRSGMFICCMTCNNEIIIAVVLWAF